MRLGETFIEFQRLVRSTFGFWHELFRIENASGNKTTVTRGQVGICGSVIRVGSYRLIEKLDSLLPIFRPSLTTKKAAPQQQFVRLRVNGLTFGELLPLACGQPQAQLLGDLAG